MASQIWKMINARNDAVHGRRPAEALLPSAQGMCELLCQAFGEPADET